MLQHFSIFSVSFLPSKVELEDTCLSQVPELRQLNRNILKDGECLYV